MTAGDGYLQRQRRLVRLYRTRAREALDKARQAPQGRRSAGPAQLKGADFRPVSAHSRSQWSRVSGLASAPISHSPRASASLPYV
jgi:hypothetical protein